MSQYNQPIYVSSNSNQNLNQQQLNNTPIQNQNGPIYVSSNVANQSNMIMPGYSAANSSHNIAQEQGTAGKQRKIMKTLKLFDSMSNLI